MSSRNDLWVLKFSEPAQGDEMLLKPSIVYELGDRLQGFVDLTLNSYGREGAVSAEVLLAGSDRGSLILSFLLFLKNNSEDISLVADLLEIASVIGDTLYRALKDAGATPASEEMRQATPHDSDVEVLVRNHALLEAAAPIISICAGTGAGRVTIELANGEPALILIGENSSDASLIGSRGSATLDTMSYMGPVKNVQGPITLVHGTLGRRDLYWATINVNGDDLVVLVDWKIDKPISDMASASGAIVAGKVHGFSLNGYRSLGRIPDELRKVRAMLTAERRLIDG